MLCNCRIVPAMLMAVSRLLRAVAALVILLSFAAGLFKLKAATLICQ